MAGSEIGTAYVSIVAETSKIAGQVKSAFDGPVASSVAASGPSIGSKLATGIGTTLKAGALTVGVAAGAALGSALSKGLDRLTAIDNAQAKLAGLGHSAQEVSSIMADALASVKGTAFGLGDAATVAATAVAAGIQPGQELQRTLKLVADSASIAGSSMSEMGAIFNSVAAQGKLMGGDLMQLQQRGIPVVKFLSETMHESMADVVSDVSKGKVSFEQFQVAMEHGLGGAALKAGNSFTGAMNNMNAALGRFGAALLGPAFKKAPGVFTDLTAKLDELTPKAQQFSQEFGTKMAAAIQKLSEGFQKLKSSAAVQDSLTRVADVLRQLVGDAQAAAPALGQIGKSLATAAGAVGVSSWQIFLSLLEAATGIINGLVGPLQTVANLMTQHQGLVTAAALAWAAFKTVPNALNLVQNAATRMSTAVSGAISPIRNLTSQTGAIVDIGNRGSVSMGKFGSAIAKVGESVPAVARMQQSFVSAASGAERFGRTAGVASAAMSGLKSAASGIGSALSSAFGGPIGIAIAAVGTALAAVASNGQNTRAVEESLKATTADLTTNMQKLGQVLSTTGGQFNGDALKQAADGIKQYRDDVAQTASQAPGFFDKIGASVNIWADAMVFRVGAAGDVMDEFDQKMADTQGAEKAKAAIDALGLSNEQLAAHLTSSDGAFQSWIQGLVQSGKISQDATTTLIDLRSQFQQVAAAASQTGKLTTGLSEIASAGDNAAQKLGGLRTALQGLGLLQTDAATGAAQLSQTIDQIASSASSGGQAMQQFADGTHASLADIDTTTEAGRNLQGALKGIGDAFLAARTSGVSSDEAMRRVAPAIAALATSSNLSEGNIRELAGAFGLLPNDVNILLSTSGSDAVHTDITGVVEALTRVPPNTTAAIHLAGGQESVDKLRALGINVTDFNSVTGTANVDVKDQASLDKLNNLKGILVALGANPANMTVNATDNATPVANAIDQQLTTLNNKPTKPKIDADPEPARKSILDIGKAGDDLGAKTWKPKVEIDPNPALQPLGSIHTSLDGLHDKTITVTVNQVQGTTVGGSWRGGLTPGRWQGGITPKVPGYASGFRLPKSGPGTGIRDGFLGLGADGMPTVRVDAGEWVVNNESSTLFNDAIAALNSGNPAAAIAALMKFAPITGSASASIGPGGLQAQASIQTSDNYNIYTVDVDAAIRSADRMQQRKCARYAGSRG